MINIVYDKIMENFRKTINLGLVNNAKIQKKYVSKPCFVSQKIFNQNPVAIHEIKPVLILDKPIYAGFSILDLSELLKYEFHYNYIKRKDNVNLLFPYTDNLVYEIKTKDFHKYLYRDKKCV